MRLELGKIREKDGLFYTLGKAYGENLSNEDLEKMLNEKGYTIHHLKCFLTYETVNDIYYVCVILKKKEQYNDE